MPRAARKKPEDRRQLILDVAIRLSTKIGYKSVTRDGLAWEADISSSLIARYFPRMQNLRDAILEEARTKEIFPVLAQALALDEIKLPYKFKRKVLRYLEER